jgi:very-short-patch-repair endonuclease
MPFDFMVGDVLIELDGEQHFTQVSNWDTPESVQVKDVEKIQKAIDEGYSVIHLYQMDVWNDTYDWKKILHDLIEELQEAPPQCVFLEKSTTNKYDTHILKVGDTIQCTLKHPE